MDRFLLIRLYIEEQESTAAGAETALSTGEISIRL